MTTYRVLAPMLTAAAFPHTMQLMQVHSYYTNDVVLGADQRDLDRLVAGGFIEAIEDPATQTAGC